MANIKTGFNFYNLDTNRYQDIKIKRLKKDFGCAGIAIYDYILCEIYRIKGCFIVWDESTAFDVADYFGVKESLVNEIVNYCGVVGLFNKELLTRERIISSLSIQDRYIEMCNRAKRINISIPKNIILTEKLNIIQEESTKHTEESILNTGSLPQSRVDKSIKKETSTIVDAKKEPETDLEFKKQEQIKKSAAAKAATLKRKDEFYKTLIPYVERYGKDMIRKFFDFWTEQNKSGTKMKFELQKTWDISLRLGTWNNREPIYGKTKSELEKTRPTVVD